MIKKSAFSLLELSVVIAVISVLVSGTLVGRKLVGTSRVNAARSLTISSPVNEMDGVELWLETTMTSSFVTFTQTNGSKIEDQDIITKWDDIRNNPGVRNSFSQSSPSKKPRYIKNVINNLPAIYFEDSGNSSTNDLLENDNSAMMVGDSGGSWFFVMQAQSKSNQVWFVDSSNVAQNGYYIGFTGQKIGFYSNRAGSGDNESETDIISDFTTKPYIVSFVFNGLESSPSQRPASIYLNSKDSTVTTKSGTSSDIVSHNSKAGLGTNKNNTAFNGYIAEVIIFNRALNSTERKDVESYLSAKWNIEMEY